MWASFRKSQEGSINMHKRGLMFLSMSIRLKLRQTREGRSTSPPPLPFSSSEGRVQQETETRGEGGKVHPQIPFVSLSWRKGLEVELSLPQIPLQCCEEMETQRPHPPLPTSLAPLDKKKGTGMDQDDP
ncbi:hypothetical protein H6P81_006140 [Aristolochia fimbriata]|uniref:Uncharacterized protein n=1 Tax=Aristolochia fimbriata TaxID=158543 RepID=A0AAV7EZB2_ARIFI|nr:hypothetical protein H6P81_006140 [Aristolochia fimbriata]